MRKTRNGGTQLTIGELLKRLQSAFNTCKPDSKVYIDFCDSIPDSFCSWRGAYEELALVVELPSMTSKRPTITEFTSELSQTIGSVYEGWKGGDYIMKSDTPLWLTSHAGFSHHTVIVGIEVDSETVTLITDTCEY